MAVTLGQLRRALLGQLAMSDSLHTANADILFNRVPAAFQVSERLADDNRCGYHHVCCTVGAHSAQFNPFSCRLIVTAPFDKPPTFRPRTYR